MFLAPKYLEGDSVTFTIDGHTLTGKVYIVDRGIWEDPNNVYYDIMAPMIGDEKTDCLYKHIREDEIL